MERFSRPNKWVDALALFVAAVSIGSYLLAERRHGLGFPVPWADEGLFLWPALAFRDRWTLFAPELDPSRDLFLMPPVYTVLVGLLFKVVPFSLALARSLSALALCGAFVWVGGLVARSRVRLAHVLILGAFLSCPIFGLIGNVARMEGAVLFLTALAFLLLDRGYTAGLGVLVLASLVHPNGMFACVAGFAYFSVGVRERKPVSRVDAVVIAGALVAWLAYAVYVALHFRGFMADMGGQLRLKEFVSQAEGGRWGRARRPLVWGPGVALILASVGARRFGVRVGALAFLAAAFFAQTIAVNGWLYEVYGAFAILLTSLVVVEVIDAALERAPWPRPVRNGVVALTCVLVVLVAVRVVGPDRSLTYSQTNSTVARHESGPTYFTSEDHAFVGQVLASLANAKTPAIVQFVPSGDGLLYEQERSLGLRYVQPTFVKTHPDFVLSHESVWLPRFVAFYELVGVLNFNAALGNPNHTVFRSRDDTEKWTLYRWPSAPSTK